MARRLVRKCAPSLVSAILVLFWLCAAQSWAQTTDDEHPVPILTGAAGYFTNIQAGQTQLAPVVAPVLLIPVGDNWLIESRGDFEGDFQRKNGNGPYGGQVQSELDYLQADYIVNPYLTITAGRFLTPFGIYNERLYPIWIRALQDEPLVFPISTGSSNGGMLRGGFPLNNKVDLNYAGYFSAATTESGVDATRAAGGRLGFFLPGLRLEAGGSWQKSLQDERKNSFGFHFAWQPNKLPLSVHSEYARSYAGSGYWLEGAYRLSQVPHWQHAMRRTEVVGRMQQFFVGEAGAYQSAEYSLPWWNTQEADFGVNYFLRDGVKAVVSYGRQFSSIGDANLWTVGIAYRFAFPLGRMQ